MNLTERYRPELELFQAICVRREDLRDIDTEEMIQRMLHSLANIGDHFICHQSIQHTPHSKSCINQRIFRMSIGQWHALGLIGVLVIDTPYYEKWQNAYFHVYEDRITVTFTMSENDPDEEGLFYILTVRQGLTSE